MSFSSGPFALIGAIIAAGICLFLAFQATALLLPFVLSPPYRWILAPTIVLLLLLGGFSRARKKRKTSLQSHQ